MPRTFRIMAEVWSLWEFVVEADSEAEARELFAEFGDGTEVERSEPVAMEVVPV